MALLGLSSLAYISVNVAILVSYTPSLQCNNMSHILMCILIIKDSSDEVL